MLYRKCACGCDKYFPLTTYNKKYYNSAHKEKARRQNLKGEIIVKTVDVDWNKLPPGERFRAMSLSEISAECARLHISYGKASQLAMDNMLPRDFGRRCKQK